MMPFRPTFTFENKEFDSAGRKFGVLNIVTNNVTENNSEPQVNLKPIHIRFNNDVSSSMDERNDHKRTSHSKIYYLKHAMIGILRHLVTISDTTNITITIYNFESNIEEIVSNVKVTKDNIDILIEKINKIQPSGCTNFENIMSNSFNELSTRIGDNPDHIYADILMTDGDITVGETRMEILKQMINSNIINAFIGYGYDQNAVLLNSFSKVVNGSYTCIDNVEKGALVYGEVLSNIINSAFVKVSISIQNGLIYDWKENKFVDLMAADNLILGSVKSFHIISDNPEAVIITIIAICSRTGEVIKVVVTEKKEEDLTNFRYRHRVLDLLDRIKCFNEKDYLFNKVRFSFYLNDDKEDRKSFNTKYKEIKKSLKDELRTLFKEIKGFIVSNGMSDDKFYKRLLDDLYITFLTFGTEHGNMYACARQCSQGDQRIYSATDTPRAPRNRDYDNINDTDDVGISCFTNKQMLSRVSSLPEEDECVIDYDECPTPRNNNRQKYSLSNDLDLSSDDENMDFHAITDDCEQTPYSNFNTTLTMNSVSNRDCDEEELGSDDDVL
uniref:VWFA domain-containing protein n=1 Tax=viral metagenome TaxID=1070528 RepID=A0A6C0IG70_9ZZZZ